MEMQLILLRKLTKAYRISLLSPTDVKISGTHSVSWFSAQHPDFVQGVSANNFSFHYHDRPNLKKKLFSRIVFQNNFQFSFPLDLKKK